MTSAVVDGIGELRHELPGRMAEGEERRALDANRLKPSVLDRWRAAS